MYARNLLSAAIAAALCVLAANEAQAQTDRWSFEGRVGSTIPRGELTNGSLNQTAGMAFGADVLYAVKTNVSLFGGVGHHRFVCDGCTRDVSSTGVDGGMKVLFGSDMSAMPWVRAGVTVHRPTVGEVQGQWSPGVDSGLGIDWLVTRKLTLVPALRYNRYTDSDLTLSYFTIDLGGHLHLGN